jgi:AcrR family transcriptional regulator
MIINKILIIILTKCIPSGILYIMNETNLSNKELIISLGIKLFSQKGYDGVGVQEIVDSANVTKPTLYYYFGSKRGLLDDIIKKYGNILFDLVKEKSFYERNITENLNMLAFAFISFAKENADFYRMQLGMYFSPQESEGYQAVALMNDKIYELVEELFEKASNDHGNMKGRSKMYAATYIGMLNSYIAMYLNGYIVIDDVLVYKIVHQFMHGIFS